MLPPELWDLVLSAVDGRQLVNCRLLSLVLLQLVPLRRVLPDPGVNYAVAICGCQQDHHLHHSQVRARWLLTEFQLRREELNLSRGRVLFHYVHCNSIEPRAPVRSTYSAVDITPASVSWLHELPVTREDLFHHYRNPNTMVGEICLFGRAAALGNLDYLQFVHRSFSPTVEEVILSLAVWKSLWNGELVIFDWLCDTYSLQPEQIHCQLAFLFRHDTSPEIQVKLVHLHQKGYINNQYIVHKFTRLMRPGHRPLMMQIVRSRGKVCFGTPV